MMTEGVEVLTTDKNKSGDIMIMTAWQNRMGRSIAASVIVGGMVGLAVFQARAAGSGKTVANPLSDGKLAPFIIGEQACSVQELFRGGRGGR